MECGNRKMTAIVMWCYIIVLLHVVVSQTRADYPIGCQDSPEILERREGTFGVNEYANNMNCTWVIKINTSQIIKLEFRNFDTEENHDVVMIFDADIREDILLDNRTNSIFKTFSGQHIPGNIFLDNTISVSFQSDGSTRHVGFSIKYSVLWRSSSESGAILMNGSMGLISVRRSTYNYNEQRSWLIQVDGNKIVKLEFLSIDTEERYDLVTIHDGMNSLAPHIGTFSGQNLPGDVFSDNVILVSFRRGSSTTHNGFRIKYTALQTKSCRNLTIMGGSMGVFGIKEYEYTNNLLCRWSIQPNPNKVTKLEFRSINLETYCDFVRVYNSRSLLNSFTGTRLPEVIYSDYPVNVRFTTDGSVKRKGFRIKYTILKDHPACGGTPVVMRRTSGQFGIREVIHVNVICGWNIQVAQTKRVRLHFNSFSLENSYNCSSQVVKVYDGNDTTVPVTYSFCGSTRPGDIWCTGSTAFVSFLTQSSGINSSFSISFSSYVPRAGCGGQREILNRIRRSISFYKSRYENRMACKWMIRLPQNMQLRLVVRNVYIENTTNCHTDFVNIYKGNDTTTPLTEPICGQYYRREIITSGNEALVTFTSDGSMTSTHFTIEYFGFMPVEGCFQKYPLTLEGVNGTFGITDSEYQKNMICGWKIQVDKTEKVNIHFVSFYVGTSYSYSHGRYCYNDRVRIYDGNDTSARLLNQSCGHYHPSNIVSSGNILFVHFYTNSYSTYPGFQIRYTSIDANCTAGEYLDVDDNMCRPCKRGTYQTNEWQIKCDICPRNMTTIGLGSKDIAGCVTNCSSGTEYNVTTGSCERCPRGTYRTQNVNDLCERCPRGRTTQTSGAFTSDKCDIADCPKGQYFKYYSGLEYIRCWDCKRGEYQDQPSQDSCIPCPQGKTTATKGSKTASDCIRDCDSGSQLDEKTGECKLCPRGFYKDTVHFLCQACPSHLITPGNGSTTKSDCYQGNCTAGQQIEGNTCVPCPLGTYQDKKWQKICIPCGSKSTTDNVGARSATECKSTDSCRSKGPNNCTSYAEGGTCTLVGKGPNYTCGCREGWFGTTKCIRECNDGQQHDEQTGTCSLCPRGSYRNRDQGIPFCKRCPSHLITPISGSTQWQDCNQGNCTAGQRIEGKACEMCPFGTYQSKKWQTICVPCENKMTTARAGATSIEECIPEKDPSKNTQNLQYVIGGSAGGVVLLLLVIIVLIVCYFARRTSADSTNNATSTTAVGQETSSPTVVNMVPPPKQTKTYQNPAYEPRSRGFETSREHHYDVLGVGPKGDYATVDEMKQQNHPSKEGRHKKDPAHRKHRRHDRSRR